jgi:hypothetical protein
LNQQALGRLAGHDRRPRIAPADDGRGRIQPQTVFTSAAGSALRPAGSAKATTAKANGTREYIGGDMSV